MLDFNQKTEFSQNDYSELQAICNDCQRCPLAPTRTQVVFGTGPTPCDIMAIGEGPGEQEDKEGVPFIGRAGQLLTKIFESVGLNRDTDIYITNTVKCRPPNNRDPHADEIAQCQHFLMRQIQLVKPKILLLIGNPALKSIMGADRTITKSRGQWFTQPVDYMEQPLYVMPIFHPSFLLRNASKEKGKPKWLTWQDMKEVKSARDMMTGN